MSSILTDSQSLGNDKFELTVQKPAGLSGGATEITVTDTNSSQSGRYSANLGESNEIRYYDQTNLPLFPDLNEWDGWHLVGYNGYIFCLPYSNVTTGTTYESIWRYDPTEKNWTKLALPINDLRNAGLTNDIVAVTGATWQGKLVLQVSDADANTLYWLYDAEGAWTQLATNLVIDEVPFRATLASDGDTLYLFGGVGLVNGNQVFDGIYQLNADTTAFEQVGELAFVRLHPQVSFRAGSFIVSGGYSIFLQGEGVGGVEYITQNGNDLESELVDFSGMLTETGQLAYASGATTTGFILAGPIDKDFRTDTYLLDTGVTVATESMATLATLTPESFDIYADDNPLLIPAATAHDGTFYVLAASNYDPYRIFSATKVGTVAQPGDHQSDPGPGPGPDPDPDPDPDPKPLPTPPKDGTAAKATAATSDYTGFIVVGLILVNLLTLCIALFAKKRRRNLPRY